MSYGAMAPSNSLYTIINFCCLEKFIEAGRYPARAGAIPSNDQYLFSVIGLTMEDMQNI